MLIGYGDTRPAGTTTAIVRAPDLVPKDKWPSWAKAMALVKNAEDTGVGDTVARLIGPATSDAFKRWHFVVFGRACGCAERQKLWNTTYPYDD